MSTTTILVVVFLILIVIADVYLAIGPISKHNLLVGLASTNSVKYPIIPFVFGNAHSLHFFWNQSLNVTVAGGCSQ